MLNLGWGLTKGNPTLWSKVPIYQAYGEDREDLSPMKEHGRTGNNYNILPLKKDNAWYALVKRRQERYKAVMHIIASQLNYQQCRCGAWKFPVRHDCFVAG